MKLCLHIELKIEEKWEHYSLIEIATGSMLSHKLVKTPNVLEIVTISQPKGLPEDINIITQLDYRRSDVISQYNNWLNLKEIKELKVWLQHTQNIDLEYDLLKCRLLGGKDDCLFDLVKEIRLVYWCYE